MATIRTAEQIVEIAERKSNTALGQRKLINRLLRYQDESNLWPIDGKFNATDRAIRHANQIERANGAMSNHEYCYFIDQDLCEGLEALTCPRS